MPLYGIFLSLIVGIVIYIGLWFGLANYTKRIDVIDVAWGLGFAYAALLTYLIVLPVHAFQKIGFALVVLWGLRLALHIGIRLTGKTEDKRYTAYREKWGDKFLFKTFVYIYLVQAAFIVIISTSMVGILDSSHSSLNLLGFIGFAVWIFGIIYETIADNQLSRFISQRKGHEIMTKGLWKLSRHPNYFGEILVWLGASIVSLSLGNWWGLISVVVISYLIIKVSGIPPLEKRYADDPDYKKYKKTTPVLIPKI